LGPLNLSLIPLHLIVYYQQHAKLLKNDIIQLWIVWNNTRKNVDKHNKSNLWKAKSPHMK